MMLVSFAGVDHIVSVLDNAVDVEISDNITALKCYTNVSGEMNFTALQRDNENVILGVSAILAVGDDVNVTAL